jgi:phosphohistidine phosphatase
MELCLVRHGIAVNIGQQGVYTDAERMLSDEGRVRTASAARGLAAHGYEADRIVASPLVRAVQTAEYFKEALEGGVSMEVCEVLYPGSDPLETLGWLHEEAQENERILLVGHMPHMSELAACLLGGKQFVSIPFKKVAACGMVCDGLPQPGSATLLWHLPPALLRALDPEPSL